LRTAVKGDDKAEIDARTQKLAELSGKIAERAYAQANEQQAGAAGGAGAQASAGAKADEGTVVDADFEEVKDDK
jgi:molecular chaperone DnaK